MNAKTLFATPSRSRSYTAGADGWRAGQAADNELLNECRCLLHFLADERVPRELLTADLRKTLAALDERLS